MAEPATITIRDGQGYISGLPPEVGEKLTAATSFRPVGYQYDWRYKKGKWDGRVKLFHHSKFPAGLVDRVTKLLKAESVLYELSTDQSNAGEKPNIQIETVGIESRPYQDEAVEAALLNPRGIIRAPTGAGKTAIGARIIALRGKHALVIVPTIDLLHQYKRFLEKHLRYPYDGSAGPDAGAYGLRIGQLGDGVVDPQVVTVATVRTAAKAMGVAYESYEYGEYDDKDDTAVSPAKLRDWIESIGTLIVDEAHILGAQSVYDIATKLPAPNKYGMSASPWRDDGADLMIEAATGQEIYRIPTKKLVDDGYLVPPIIRVIDTKGWWKPAAWGQVCAKCSQARTKDRNGPAKRCRNCGSERWRSEFIDAYKHEIVDNPIRNFMVADETLKAQGPVLVLVKQVKHGRTLEKLIRGSKFLSGTASGEERMAVYDELQADKLHAVIATTIADLGLDLPVLRTLILAGGGKSSVRHLQRIGRVVRPAPGKKAGMIIDLDDGHVHKWFREHAAARRKIEKAEWAESAIWI